MTTHRPRHRSAFLVTPLAAILVAGLLPGALGTAMAQDDGRAADHEELIALREQFTKALNERNFELLEPLVTDSMTFVSISNERVDGLDGLKAYWMRLFEGDNSVLTSMTVSPKADERTVFFGDTIGVTQGTSDDIFEFRAVGTRKLTTRWTAVVEKSAEKWKVARVHMSANVLDNPVLDAQATIGNIKMGGGAVVGLGLGALLFRRRKTA